MKKVIEVAYADTDMMGVVYHANYLVWFEVARTDFLVNMGFSMHECIERGLIFPITSVEMKYKNPTRYLDEVYVETEVLKMSKTSTTYLQKSYANGKLCVEAKIVLAHVLESNFKPANLSKVYPELFKKYNEVKIDEKS